MPIQKNTKSKAAPRQPRESRVALLPRARTLISPQPTLIFLLPRIPPCCSSPFAFSGVSIAKEAPTHTPNGCEGSLSSPLLCRKRLHFFIFYSANNRLHTHKAKIKRPPFRSLAPLPPTHPHTHIYFSLTDTVFAPFPVRYCACTENLTRHFCSPRVEMGGKIRERKERKDHNKCENGFAVRCVLLGGTVAPPPNPPPLLSLRSAAITNSPLFSFFHLSPPPLRLVPVVSPSFFRFASCVRTLFTQTLTLNIKEERAVYPIATPSFFLPFLHYYFHVPLHSHRRAHPDRRKER